MSLDVVRRSTVTRFSIGPGQYIKLQNVQCFQTPDGRVYCIIKGDRQAYERILREERLRPEDLREITY